jgi:hypothetical protein
MPIFKIILDICLLRGRASDLPASMNLVWLTAVASVAVNLIGMPTQDLDLAQLLFIVSQAVMFGAAVWLLLKLRGFPARWMQTITALYAVDAVFSLLLLPFLPALMDMIKQGPEIKPGWEAYLLLVLSGWLLLIIARVLREATEWPLPLAFLAGFATLLAVRILGHLLAPLFGLMVEM